MIDTESRLNLERDRAEVHAYLSERGGGIACDIGDDAVYWLGVVPRAQPAERFTARVIWTAYPWRPASVKFCDGIAGRVDAGHAWPQLPGYRHGSWDICKPFTAEGYALHPEWATDTNAWRTEGNPFLWVVQTLQRDLDTDFAGRGA